LPAYFHFSFSSSFFRLAIFFFAFFATFSLSAWFFISSVEQLNKTWFLSLFHTGVFIKKLPAFHIYIFSLIFMIQTR